MITLWSAPPPDGTDAFVPKSVGPGLRIGTAFRGLVPFVVVDVERIALPIAFPRSLCSCPR